MPHVETFDPELERAHRRMDDIERKLQRFNNPTPTIPEYDLQLTSPTPPYIFARGYETSKTHPPWWNLDDKYNGDTSWVSSFSAGDVAYLGKFDGSLWQLWSSPVGGIHGFWTPSSPAPGTTPPTVPVGSVGNDFITELDAAYTNILNSGDQIAVIAYRITALDAPSTVIYSNNPYLEEHFIVYENDGTTVMHDFGAMLIDLGPYNPPPSSYPPGFYVPPSSDFFLSSVWTVP